MICWNICMYFFFLCLLLFISHAQPTTTPEIQVYSESYDAIGWKNFSQPSQNVSLNFEARATSDIHLGLQYGQNQYIEIVIAGWGNRQSVVRNFMWGYQYNEIPFPSPTAIIPDTANFVTVSVSLENGVITTTINNAVVFSQYFDFAMNKTFTSYGFRAYSAAPWTERNTTIIKPAPVELLPGEKLLTTSNFSDYGWKVVTNPSKNIALSFSAQTTNDLHIGLQYSPDRYILIAIGGWNNSQGVIRNNSMSEQTFNDINFATAIIPDTTKSISYKISIAPSPQQPGMSTLTVTANETIILSYTDSFLNQNFTNYSFRSWPPTTLKLSGENVTTTQEAQPAQFFTGYTVPSGTYWLVQPNNFESFLAANGASWGTTKDPFVITRNPSNLSYNSVNYPANAGTLDFSIPNFVFIPATVEKSITPTQEQWITTNLFNNWTPIAPTGNKVTLSFNAITPQADMYVAFQYGPNQYIKLAIGGWGNSQSGIQNISYDATINEKYIPSAIPSLTDSVAYVISITPSITTPGSSTLTVSANGNEIISYTDAFLSQQYSAYGFIAYSTSYWKIIGGTPTVTSSNSSNQTQPQQQPTSEQWITTNSFNNWTPISPTGNKVTLSFNAQSPQGDLYAGFQYGPNQYIKIILGGWGNSQSGIQNISYDATINEKYIPSAIPSLTDSVAYVISITPSTTAPGSSTLTVSANGNQIISYTDAFLSQQYSAYGFMAYSTSYWKILGGTPTVTSSNSSNALSQTTLETVVTNMNTAMSALSTQANQATQIITSARSDFRTVADQMKITIKFPWE